ncbi:MAG: GNAT family N-acetyltransferase [Actinomycetota bacterium]
MEYRPLDPAEFDALIRMLGGAFGEDAAASDREEVRLIFETGRTWGGYDAGELVGCSGACAFDLTTPGGTVGTAGITTVAVLPTHRRRGVMREVLRRQVDELHQEGHPTAYLWASEGAIYQRFGYGTGAPAAAFDIRKHRTAFLRPHQPAGRVRLIERSEAFKAFPSVYDRVRPGQPGMLDRPGPWWELRFHDSPEDREGASSYFFALHEAPDGPDGYVVYRVKHDWSSVSGVSEGMMDVEELVAATRGAYADLWRFCFDVDLIGRIKGFKRPVDEPLLHMLAEPRALGLRFRDGTWLRLIDVPAALEARRYAVADRVRLEVRDEFCPWNEGTWELQGGPEGASCTRFASEPDLVLDVSDLAGTYLGAVPFATLARAGRVAEAKDGAVRRADAMFAADLAPWCPHIF